MQVLIYTNELAAINSTLRAKHKKQLRGETSGIVTIEMNKEQLSKLTSRYVKSAKTLSTLEWYSKEGENYHEKTTIGVK